MIPESIPFVVIFTHEPRTSFLHSIPGARAFHAWSARKFVAAPEAHLHAQSLGLRESEYLVARMNHEHVTLVEAAFSHHFRPIST